VQLDLVNTKHEKSLCTGDKAELKTGRYGDESSEHLNEICIARAGVTSYMKHVMDTTSIGCSTTPLHH
jgi:hypothetical protein